MFTAGLYHDNSVILRTYLRAVKESCGVEIPGAELLPSEGLPYRSTGLEGQERDLVQDDLFTFKICFSPNVENRCPINPCL